MSVSDQLKILKHKLIGYQKTLKEVKESLENLDKKNRQEIQAQEIQLEKWRKELEVCKQEELKIKQTIKTKVSELEQSQLSNTEKQARINQLLTEHSTELEELDNLLDEERSSYRTIRNKLISKLCENCAVCQERERMIQVYEDRVTSFKILFGITLVASIIVFFLFLYSIYYLLKRERESKKILKRLLNQKCDYH